MSSQSLKTNQTGDNSDANANNLIKQQPLKAAIFQLTDTQPKAIVQRVLQEMVNNSPQIKHLRGLQAMVDNNSAKKPLQKTENKTPISATKHMELPNPGLSIDQQAPGKQKLPDFNHIGRSKVLQPKVGYEFETGWMVWKRIIDPSNDEDTGIINVPLAKKDKIGSGTYPGFKVEADEAHAGNSEIEFIVDPPVEESTQGLKNLEQIMSSMNEFCEKLLVHKGKADFRLNDATGSSGDNSFVIAPDPKDGNNLEAGPQVTTGLEIEKIPEFLGAVQNYEVEKPKTNSPKMEGLLFLIKNYLETGAVGNSPVNYPKRIAEPLLARTNFVKLFELTEDNKQIYYKQNPEIWIKDVLEFADLPIEQAGKDIIARSIVDDKDTEAHTELNHRIARLQNECDYFNDLSKEIEDIESEVDRMDKEIIQNKNRGFLEKIFDKSEKTITEQIKNMALKKQSLVLKKALHFKNNPNMFRDLEFAKQQKKDMEKYTGLTVSQWLLGILGGVDKLTSIKEAESLGEYGKKVENVGPNNDMEAGIFEFRGDQKKKIPSKEWSNYATTFFKKILKVHGH